MNPRRILLSFRIPEGLRDVLTGIADYAKQRHANWQVQCVDVEELGSTLSHHRADGAITVVPARGRQMIERLRRWKTPVVNMIHDAAPRLASVLSDDRAIGEAGAEYLLGRGFRRFAFIAVDTPWGRAREAGFRARIERERKGPVAVNAPLGMADFRFLSRVRALTSLRKFARSLEAPVAVMAPADFVGSVFEEACGAEGLRVPADIAILGVDNFHTVCELAPVPLSSIAQDFVRMGFEAARLLDGMMANKRARAETPVLIAPGRVTVRQSTDVLAYEDPVVVAALQLIQRYAAGGGGGGGGITMKELLRQVPMSRKWLDARFKKVVGHTASAEIRRRRLETVRELLTETDMPLRAIAARSGFSCVENLIRGFRAGFGMPPQMYRRNHRRTV